MPRTMKYLQSTQLFQASTGLYPRCLFRNISLHAKKPAQSAIGRNVRKRAVQTPSALMKAIKFRRYNLSPDQVAYHPQREAATVKIWTPVKTCSLLVELPDPWGFLNWIDCTRMINSEESSRLPL